MTAARFPARQSVLAVGMVVLLLSAFTSAPVMAADPTPDSDEGYYGFEDGSTQGWNKRTDPTASLGVQDTTSINGSWSLRFEDTSSSDGARGEIQGDYEYTDFHLNVTFNNTYNDVKQNRIYVGFGGTSTGSFDDDQYGQTSEYYVSYGNLGGTDSPELAVYAPDDTVIASKAVEPPKDTDIIFEVDVNETGYVRVNSYYASSGSKLHSLETDLSLPYAPKGYIAVGAQGGSGAVPVIFFDDLHVTDATKWNSMDAAGGDGRAIGPLDQFQYTGSSVYEKYDLLNDSGNYSKMVEAYDQNPNDGTANGNWSSAGAGSLFNETVTSGDGTNTWWMSLRQRTSEHRGQFFDIYNNTDRIGEVADWKRQVRVNMTTTTDSVEGNSLKMYDGTWYFYFSYDVKSLPNSQWAIAYVTASSVNGLESQLKDRGTWNNLTQTGKLQQDVNDGDDIIEKDPTVFRWEGRYYMLTGSGGDGGYDTYLYRDDNPGFSSPTYIGNPVEPIHDKRGVQPSNPGTIMFDESSGKFLYWTHQLNTTSDNIDWAWSYSTDLENWNFADARSTGEPNLKDQGINTAPRYFDYALADVQSGTGVIMFSWDPDDDAVGSLYLWDYSPAIQAQYDKKTLSGTVTDNETASAISGATVTIYDNTGTQVNQTTTGSDGQYSVQVRNHADYTVGFSATGYEDKNKTVTIDGATTVDAALTPNDVPYVNDANPTGGKLVDSRTVTLNVTVTDPEGTDVTVAFYVLNSSGVYTKRGTDTVPSGGTAEITGVQAEPGENAWYAKITDGDGNSDTSPAFLFNTPGNVEIYDATTASDPDNYALTSQTVTVQIVSLDSDFSQEQTISDGDLALDGMPDETLVMTFTATNRTTQRLVVNDLSSAYHVLLYDDANAYTQGFTLEDNTGDFPPGDSYVVMKQRYAGSWRIVASDYFGGVNLAQVELVDGTEYRIEVHNSQGDMRQLGSFTGDSANEGSPTQLVINDPTQDITIERGSRYKWSAYAANDSADPYIYLDVQLLTNSTSDYTQFKNVSIVMYERGNRSNTVYTADLGVQENFTVVEVLSHAQYNEKTWVVEWNATVGGDDVGGKKVVGATQRKVPVPLDGHYKGVAGTIMLLFTATLFTRANAAFGSLATALVGALLWYVGFLPAVVGGGSVVVAIGFGAAFVAQERGNPAT